MLNTTYIQQYFKTNDSSTSKVEYINQNVIVGKVDCISTHSSESCLATCSKSKRACTSRRCDNYRACIQCPENCRDDCLNQVIMIYMYLIYKFYIILNMI